MKTDTAIVILKLIKKKQSIDLEVPLYITANELVTALNTAYELNIDLSDIKNCYLKAENPIALLRGNKTLADFGIRDGSIILYTE